MRITVWFGLITALALSPAAKAQAPKVSAEGQQCLDCHEKGTPGAVQQWQSSAHAAKGVDCYSCHRGRSRART